MRDKDKLITYELEEAKKRHKIYVGKPFDMKGKTIWQTPNNSTIIK